MFAVNRLWIYGLGIVFFAAACGFSYLKGDLDGQVKCERSHAAAQAEHVKKVKKIEKKVKNATPDDDNVVGIADFLRRRTTR